MDLDVKKICRLCCEKKSRLRSLFEKRSDYPLSLQQIIFDISRLEVEPNDGMPQKVCTWCATTLLKIYKSVEMFRANDLKLRQQLVGVLPVEIKQEEEEVDVEMLEKAFTQELEVEGIRVKEEVMEEEAIEEEAMEEEYLEEELNEDSVVIDPKNDSESIQPKQAAEDTENEEETVEDKDDDEDWKPTAQDTEEAEEKKPPVKKVRRKAIRRLDADGKPIRRGGRRKKPEDPNRPRKHDFKCYICKSESHGTSEALLAHLNSMHSDQLPYTCPDCVTEDVVINRVQGLNAHMRQHLNTEKCPYCDKRYTCKKNVDLHVEMHHKEGNVDCPSTCSYCGEVYPSKVSLLHHMKLHTTAASCEVCGKIFKERHKLRLHIQRRHEKIKKYECHFCQKKLGSLDSVQNHIRTYHSNQEFKCSYCPKTFTSELTHRAHEKKHQENPNYVATRDWKDYYTVLEGEESNPAAKLKKCKLCGAICKSIGIHLSMIHFPKEMRCKICDMTFKRKQNYDIHVLEHEYGKAHQCPICGREFSDRKNMYVHLRTKKHRDHPMAKAILGNLRSTKKSKEESFEAEEQEQIEVEEETVSFM